MPTTSAEPPESADGPSRPGDAVVWAALNQINQLSSAVTRGRLSERAAAAAGISVDRPAMGVLLTLHSADGPLRVGEIAERMQVVGPHVTRQVQELERRGLVRRVADPYDRRASLIEPTEQGASATDRYSASIIGWFTEAIADWPDRDRNELGRLLGMLAKDVIARLARLEDDAS